MPIDVTPTPAWAQHRPRRAPAAVLVEPQPREWS
jgi:hypothetical protein